MTGETESSLALITDSELYCTSLVHVSITATHNKYSLVRSLYYFFESIESRIIIIPKIVYNTIVIWISILTPVAILINSSRSIGSQVNKISLSDPLLSLLYSDCDCKCIVVKFDDCQ